MIKKVRLKYSFHISNKPTYTQAYTMETLTREIMINIAEMVKVDKQISYTIITGYSMLQTSC